MPLPFKKIEPSRRFQSVMEQIEKAILDGEFKPGDLLPSEMKLKEIFDTSRSTIREALRVLEEKGLVEIRVGGGGGAIVKDITTDKITAALKLLMQYQKVSLDHLAQFREGVEGLVTELAALNATDEDIARLQALLRKIALLVDREDDCWEAFVRLDIEFHIALTEIARNPVYTAVLCMVHQYMLGEPGQFAPKDKARLKANYDDLCRIVDAVAAHDAQRAGQAARDHVYGFRRHVGKAYI